LKLYVTLDTRAINRAAQVRPAEASHRSTVTQGRGYRNLVLPLWGGPRAPTARGGGGQSLGNYRLIRNNLSEKKQKDAN